jgi:hypothetical protein
VIFFSGRNSIGRLILNPVRSPLSWVGCIHKNEAKPSLALPWKEDRVFPPN